jgi:hypothetical protein
MVPRGEREVLSASSSIFQHNAVSALHLTQATHKNAFLESSSQSPLRSCLKEHSSALSSSSNFGLSFSSISSSTSSRTSLSSSRRVTFQAYVVGKIFVPDWADPRVQAYERKHVNKSASSDQEDQRLVDFHCIQVLRKERQQRCSPPTATGSTADRPSRTKLSLWEDKWCPRGLECHFDEEVCNRKRHMRLQSVLSVLLLQARKVSWKEMAVAYSRMSQKSFMEAHRQGLLDELEAKHEVGQTVLNVLIEHRKHKWQNGKTPEGSSWMARRPARRSRRFSQLVVGEDDTQWT